MRIGKLIRWVLVAMAVYILFSVLTGPFFSVVAGKALLIALLLILVLALGPALKQFKAKRTLEAKLRAAVNDREEFQRLLRAAPPSHALKIAAERGEPALVRELLAKGADPDDYAPLMAAAAAGSEESVRLLISAGADLNQITEPSSAYGKKRNALGAAVFAGHANVVELLLLKGADPTSALRVAISCRSEDMIKLLLEHGADIGALPYDDADDSATVLAEIGEEEYACIIARNSVGVVLPALDQALTDRARALESLFAASAERCKSNGDITSAGEFCNFMLDQWTPTDHEFAREDARFLGSSVCLRTLAEIEEEQGNVREALTQYRQLVNAWESIPEVDEVLRSYTSEVERLEWTAALRGYARMLERVGETEKANRVLARLRMVERAQVANIP